MSVGGDYTQPVSVNGYQCWNCGQVADAKQGVNPADVKPGETPAQAEAASGSNTTLTAAVTFGGSLTATNSTSAAQQTTGAWLNLTA